MDVLLGIYAGVGFCDEIGSLETFCLPEPHRPFATSPPTRSHARGGIRQIPETSTRRCSYSSLFPLVSALLSWDTNRKFLMFFQKAHAVHAGDQHASSSLDSIQSDLERLGERGG